MHMSKKDAKAVRGMCRGGWIVSVINGIAFTVLLGAAIWVSVAISYYIHKFMHWLG